MKLSKVLHHIQTKHQRDEAIKYRPLELFEKKKQQGQKHLLKATSSNVSDRVD